MWCTRSCTRTSGPPRCRKSGGGRPARSPFTSRYFSSRRWWLGLSSPWYEPPSPGHLLLASPNAPLLLAVYVRTSGAVCARTPAHTRALRLAVHGDRANSPSRAVAGRSPVHRGRPGMHGQPHQLVARVGDVHLVLLAFHAVLYPRVLRQGPENRREGAGQPQATTQGRVDHGTWDQIGPVASALDAAICTGFCTGNVEMTPCSRTNMANLPALARGTRKTMHDAGTTMAMVYSGMSDRARSIYMRVAATWVAI